MGMQYVLRISGRTLSEAAVVRLAYDGLTGSCSGPDAASKPFLAYNGYRRDAGLSKERQQAGENRLAPRESFNGAASLKPSRVSLEWGWRLAMN